MSDFTVTVLGSRGSVSIDGADYQKYGCATSCYMVRAGEQIIFLDAGTGIIDASKYKLNKDVSVLISHFHLDHIVGLPFYEGMSDPGTFVRLYGVAKDDDELKKLFDDIIRPPYWPLTLEDYPSKISFNAVNGSFMIGDVKVDMIIGNHPNKAYIFKLGYDGRSLVYMTDYEHTDTFPDELLGFVSGADLVLYDAQYTDEEYVHKRGFGHSTARMGLKLKDMCSIKKMCLIHHHPARSDESMEMMERTLKRSDVSYALKYDVMDV